MTQRTAPPMTAMNDDQRKMDLFRTMARAWHEQDWETCADLFAVDGVLHSRMLEPVVSRQAIYDRISKLGGEHKRVTLHIHRMGVIGGVLFVERTDEIVLPGHRGECPAVGVIEFEGDKIKRWSDYYDRAQLERAAGHAPRAAA